MSNVRDLTGRRFGRLVVLYNTDERKYGKVVWLCKCDCGNEVGVIGRSLTSGDTTSCGCYQKEHAVEVNTIHGMASNSRRHSIYTTWQTILQRCENPNNHDYKDYGGRGIAVCAEWHDPQVFVSWALANGWEKGLQIDRINNDGNYEPDNCRFVTSKENNRNKRNNNLITFDGKTQTMAEWAEELNVSAKTLCSRITQRYWPIERALTESVRGRKDVRAIQAISSDDSAQL